MSAALTSIHSDSVDAGDFGVLVHGGAGFVPEALVPAHIEGCRAAAREGRGRRRLEARPTHRS